MFDFKLLVESLLLELDTPVPGDTPKPTDTSGSTATYDELIGAIKSKYAIEPNRRVEQTAWTTAGTLRYKPADFSGLNDADTILLNCCGQIRQTYLIEIKRGASGRITNEADIKQMLSNTSVQQEIYKLIQKVNKEIPFKFIDVYGFVEAVNKVRDLQALLADQLLKQHSNSTILKTTIDIVKTNLKKDYTNIITDIFYNPVKYKTGGSVPPELRGDLDDLIYISYYTRVLYDSLTPKPETEGEPKTESLLIPALIVGAPLIAKAGEAIWNYFTNKSIHGKNNDEGYKMFITKGTIAATPNKVYTISTLEGMSTNQIVNNLLKYLKDLAFHTNIGPTGQEQVGNIVKNLVGGSGTSLAGAAKW
jgi:hypothetical protein